MNHCKIYSYQASALFLLCCTLLSNHVLIQTVSLIATSFIFSAIKKIALKKFWCLCYFLVAFSGAVKAILNFLDWIIPGVIRRLYVTGKHLISSAATQWMYRRTLALFYCLLVGTIGGGMKRKRSGPIKQTGIYIIKLFCVSRLLYNFWNLHAVLSAKFMCTFLLSPLQL